MKKPTESKHIINAHFSRGEELFNGISHAVGVAVGIAILVLGIVFSAIYEGNALAVLSMITYGVSIIVLYAASSLYHFLPQGRAKHIVQIMDHCSIYLLIAGTYTPFCLILLGSITAGWVLFGIVWGFAILGIVLNAINMNNKIVKIYSLVSYVGIGWACVFVFRPLLANMATLGFILLLLGGVIYTVGAVLYVISQKRRYVHSVWHMLVLAGTLFQFFSILLFVVIV